MNNRAQTHRLTLEQRFCMMIAENTLRPHEYHQDQDHEGLVHDPFIHEPFPTHYFPFPRNLSPFFPVSSFFFPFPRARMYLSTCVPVYLSTCLPPSLSTCVPYPPPQARIDYELNYFLRKATSSRHIVLAEYCAPRPSADGVRRGDMPRMPAVCTTFLPATCTVRAGYRPASRRSPLHRA